MDSVAPDALVELVDAELRSIEAGRDAEAALHRVTRRLCDELGDACVVFGTSGEAQVEMASLAHRDPVGEKMLATRVRVELSESAVIAQVVKTGKPVVVSSTSAKQVRSFMSDKMAAYLDRFGLSSLLLVPMRAEGRVVGCVAMLRVERGSSYPPELAPQMQVLADQLALALHSGGLAGNAGAGSHGARAQRKPSLGAGLASFIRGDGPAAV